MSYAQTTIIMWGVYLTPEQAKRIYEKHIKGSESGNIAYDKADCITEEVIYNKRGVDVFRERHMPQMVADEADSRVHDLSYSNECTEHCLGTYVASKGYAYMDDIDYHVQRIGGKSFTNFDKYIKPILEAEGINLEPKMRIVSQVW